MRKRDNKPAVAIVSLLVGLFVLIPAFGQNLRTDNPHYINLLRLEVQAARAYEDAEYDDAVRLAREARQEAALAEAWAEAMVLRFRANSMITVARNELTRVRALDAASRYPDVYRTAQQNFERAERLFREGHDAVTARNYTTADSRYQESYDLASTARTAVADIGPAPRPEPTPEPAPEPEPGPPPLPRYYVVRLIPERRDSFSRIAEYEFVYGDAYKWRVLYEANRDKIVNPDNPHLIHPGQVFEIPSIDGEEREGTWSPD